MAGATTACIGEPISWLRLETFARGEAPPALCTAIETHLAACPACRHCLDEIADDVVALPPLAVPAAPPRRAWWPRLVPALAFAAAAVLVLVLWRGREATVTSDREDLVRVKGIGDVVLGVVRERAGVIRDDVRSFAPGDRWKVIVTCPPSASAQVAITVAEVGDGASAGIDRPLPPTTITCGNGVVLPGAFTLTGTRANRVCARISDGAGPGGVACVTLRPE